MERLAHIEHYIVRCIHHIIDTSLTHGFKRLYQPLGRRAHRYIADIPGNIPLTETRLIDLYTHKIRRWLKNGHVSQRIDLHRQL